MPSNLERLIRLAGEVFDMKNDPDQPDVDEKVLGQLRRIHPAIVSEFSNEDGPVAWVLVIPTTRAQVQIRTVPFKLLHGG